MKKRVQQKVVDQQFSKQHDKSYNKLPPSKGKIFINKKSFRILRKDWTVFFPKLSLNSQISYISTSFKKKICILSHIAKKLQACYFLQTAFPKK